MDIHLKPHLQLSGCSLRAETPWVALEGPNHTLSDISRVSHSSVLPVCHTPRFWLGELYFALLMPLPDGFTETNWYFELPHLSVPAQTHPGPLCLLCAGKRLLQTCPAPPPLHKQVWATPSWGWCLHRGFAGRFLRDPSVVALSCAVESESTICQLSKVTNYVNHQLLIKGLFRKQEMS